MTSYVTELYMSDKPEMDSLQKLDAKKKLEKLYKEESKLVKGIFKNHESPGSELEFTYKAFAQDPHRRYKLMDGVTYEIPLGVAKHINNNCVVKQHKKTTDESGHKVVSLFKAQDKFQFLSTEFI